MRNNILLLQGISRILKQPDDHAGAVPCHEETGQDQSQGQDQKQVCLRWKSQRIKIHRFSIDC
jgi:hypothetical protein